MYAGDDSDNDYEGTSELKELGLVLHGVASPSCALAAVCRSSGYVVPWSLVLNADPLSRWMSGATGWRIHVERTHTDVRPTCAAQSTSGSDYFRKRVQDYSGRCTMPASLQRGLRLGSNCLNQVSEAFSTFAHLLTTTSHYRFCNKLSQQSTILTVSFTRRQMSNVDRQTT